MIKKPQDILSQKSFNFSIRIVKLHRFLLKEKNESLIAKQIFRSGTNPGAMIRESKFAESSKDFIHKLHVALKEIEETIYWLDLLAATGFLSTEIHESLKYDATEIAKLLTSSIKTKKNNLTK